MTAYLAVGLLGVSLGVIVTPLVATDPAPAPKPRVYAAAVDVRPTQNVAALDAHSVALAERQVAVIAEAKREEAARLAAAKAAQAERERQARANRIAAEQAEAAEAKRVAQAKAAASTPPPQKATPAARQFNAPAKAKPAPAAQGQRFEATAYTAWCDTGCVGITATGLDVSNTIYTPRGHRVIAVDPGVIPLGAVVTVKLSNGVSFSAEAADTGGRIVGNKIDILTASHAEAVRFGRQAVTIIR